MQILGCKFGFAFAQISANLPGHPQTPGENTETANWRPPRPQNEASTCPENSPRQAASNALLFLTYVGSGHDLPIPARVGDRFVQHFGTLIR